MTVRSHIYENNYKAYNNEKDEYNYLKGNI